MIHIRLVKREHPFQRLETRGWRLEKTIDGSICSIAWKGWAVNWEEKLK